jgi:hypothetical protein
MTMIEPMVLTTTSSVPGSVRWRLSVGHVADHRRPGARREDRDRDARPSAMLRSRPVTMWWRSHRGCATTALDDADGA